MSEKHLCVECNLCCRGSIFSYAFVYKKEMRRLPKADFYISDKRAFMRLGCKYLGCDGGCEVYESRPRTCKNYRCNLLTRYEKKEIGAAAAKKRVEDIKMLEATAIRMLAEASPDGYRRYDFTSAIDARNYFEALEARKLKIDKHKKDAAWLWLEMFIATVRHEIEERFLK